MAGNTIVYLYSPAEKKLLPYEVYITSITTATNNQYAPQQLHSGMNFIPIRRSEMFVTFTIAWPLQTATRNLGNIPLGFEGIDYRDGFTRMNRFQDAIRQHQLAMTSTATPHPMSLHYGPGDVVSNTTSPDPLTSYSWSDKDNPNEFAGTKLAPLNFEGWIQSSEKEYARFKTVFFKTYTMNIINPNTAGTASTSMMEGTSVTFAPTAATQRNYNGDWANTQTLINNAPTKGLPVK